MDLGIHGLENDLDSALVHHDHGPVGEDVRTNRSEDDRMHVGMHDRPPGGQIVCRGPGRRGDDQPVGLKVRDMLAVNVDREIDDLGQGAPVDDDVIQHGIVRNLFSLPHHRGRQHDPLIIIHLPIDDLLECRVEFLKGDLGQESKAAEIDPENRDIPACDQACHAEKRPVAAENGDQVRLLRDLGHLIGARLPDDGRGLPVKECLDLFFPEIGEEFPEDIGSLQPAFCNDTDFHERGPI